MKKELSLILFVLSFTSLYSQNFHKIVYDDSDSKGYYLAVPPKSEKIIGVLLLLPGFAQDAESIFPESKLHNVAYVNKILTIAIAGGRKLYADNQVIDRLNDAIIHVKEKYKVASDQFIIGGYSAGGTISLGYAEYCNSTVNAPMKPQGVFAVDSPVDLFMIWDYFQREIAKNYSEAGVGEAKFISEIMLSEIGDPNIDVGNYDRLTPFNASKNEPGNEIHLKNTPLRLYEDIDVEWQLNNRRRSLFDSNSLPASELINRLLLLGNEEAEFVTAKQPGFRSAGFRHPHSWSIIDEIDLINWAKAILEK